MTPNSVRQLAPSSVYSPPAIHKKRIADGAWSCSATSPGVRRIPTPIVPPTLTARPKPRPRTRRSWPDFSNAIRARSIRRSDLKNTCDLCAAGRATLNYDARGATNRNAARGCNRLKPLPQKSFRIPEESRVTQYWAVLRLRLLTQQPVCLGDMRPPGGTPLGNFSEGQKSAGRLTL
jgi:hypothetical protein